MINYSGFWMLYQPCIPGINPTWSVKQNLFYSLFYLIWIWELDYKESWALKNWCFWTVVLEKTLESPWTARRSNQSIVKEISPEYFLEGLMLKLKLQSLATWCKEVTHLKRPWDTGKDWRREEKGMTEDEMAGWYHRLHGHEFEKTPEVGDGQGGLACCNPWGCKQSHVTEQLNWW